MLFRSARPIHSSPRSLPCELGAAHSASTEAGEASKMGVPLKAGRVGHGGRSRVAAMAFSEWDRAAHFPHGQAEVGRAADVEARAHRSTFERPSSGLCRFLCEARRPAARVSAPRAESRRSSYGGGTADAQATRGGPRRAPARLGPSRFVCAGRRWGSPPSAGGSGSSAVSSARERGQPELKALSP